jgi:hypothetical protein
VINGNKNESVEAIDIIHVDDNRRYPARHAARYNI